ncbi:MAG: AlpA family transcriptional regulator [Roseovarius sp.]|jgi:prophage regulatory protein
MTRFIRRPAVEDQTGLSRSTIYMLMQNGQFPKPVRIGGRAVAWPEAEVEAWLNARLAEREEAR